MSHLQQDLLQAFCNLVFHGWVESFLLSLTQLLLGQVVECFCNSVKVSSVIVWHCGTEYLYRYFIATCTSKQSVRCSVKINYCKCWFQKAVTFDIGVCVLWRDNAVKILSQSFNSSCTVVQKDNLLLTSFMYVILLLLIISSLHT